MCYSYSTYPDTNFFEFYCDHRYLHSFPTRRSSELGHDLISVDGWRGSLAQREHDALVEPLVATGSGRNPASLGSGAEQSPPVLGLSAPECIVCFAPCTHGLLLDVQAVLDVGGTAAEHPKTRPRLGCDGAHPQMRSDTRLVRQRDEGI